MKAGARALGVAESYRGDVSTLAGAVVRASRVVDGFVFGSCTVGGRDATATIVELVDRLDREDVQYLLVAGVAPAWYNIVDLTQLYEQTGLPALSVSFEESEGLEPAIEDAFEGEGAATRIDTYRSLPPRNRVDVDGTSVFVRAVGIDAQTAGEVVRGYTPEGGRPEPVRVARLAARAAETYRDPD